MSVDQIRALAVAPFPLDPVRPDLFGRLCAWHAKLISFGLSCTVWLDGSFLTTKPGPGDIDLVVWGLQANRQLSTAEMLEVEQLFDHAVVKHTFGLDLYLDQSTPDQLVNKEAYWMGFLGFCHDRRTAKGFAEVAL